MSEPSKLSKRLERTRQKIELLQAQRQLRMLESFERGQRLPVRLPKAQQNLQESSSEAWQWVSGYQDVIDRFNGTDRDFIFPFSTAMDRRYGENWPFWRTWQEHARLRAASRLIWTLSPLASGAISALTSYVVGEGMQTKIAGKDKDVAKELVAAVQAVVDSIIDRNDWMTMQQECFTRARRDGEFFLRDFPQDDGMTLFRIVDPEQIMEPPGMSREEASFGIITDPDDLLDIRGYWWAPRGVPSFGEYLPSSDVLHVKENVDGIIKRGLPDFAFDTQQLYKTVNRLLINMGQGASIQSAIAFVRQHKNVDTASIEAFVNAQGDYSETRPFTGVQQTIQRLEGGSVIDMDANQDFVKSPGADNVSGFTQVVQALLRAVATRWNAPEWIVSADASNNNMASSMVAESPFVKTCKRFQHRYARAFKHVIAHALRHYCRVRGGLRVGMSKYTWATLSQLIDVQVVPPTVETRDRQQEAMVNRTYVELGVKSRKTIATELGLDWDAEQQNNDEYDKAHPQGGQDGTGGGNPLAAMMGGSGDQPPGDSPPDEPQPPDNGGGDDNTNQPPQDDNEDFSDLEGFLDSIDLNESRRSTLNQFADTEIHSTMHTQILFDPAKTIFSEGEWVNSVLNQPTATPLIESRQTSSLTELEAFASQLPVDERLSYIRQALLEGRGIDKLGRVICWNDKGKRIPCNQEKSETSHKDRQRANEGLQKLMAAPHAVTPKDAESVAKALKHLAHDELAALKKQHGLRASGKKEELINRLVGAASKILTQRQQYERQARAEGVPPAYVNSIAQQNYKIGAGYVREARKLIWAARDYYEGMTGKKLRIMRANGRMDPSSIPELELIARGLKTQYPGFLNPDEMADDTENARVLFDLLVTGGPAMPDRGEMYKQAIEQAKYEAKKAEDDVPFDMEGLGDEKAGETETTGSDIVADGDSAAGGDADRIDGSTTASGGEGLPGGLEDGGNVDAGSIDAGGGGERDTGSDGEEKVTASDAESRKWKKNDDGTYTSPDGTIWRKAKAGGEHSPVNGKFFQGGWLMPIHGKSSVADKSDAVGGDGGVKVGTGGQKSDDAPKNRGGSYTPREPVSPEVHAENARRQSMWDDIKSGPLAQLKWLGDQPNGKALSDRNIRLDKWKEFADTIGSDQVGQLKEVLLPYVIDHWKAKFEEMASDPVHVRNREAFGAKPMDVTEEVQWHVGQLQDRALEAATSTPRLNKQHLKSNPDSFLVRELVSEAIGQAQDNPSPIDSFYDVSKMVQLFTGTDALGREWINGKLKPVQDDSSEQTPQEQEKIDAGDATGSTGKDAGEHGGASAQASTGKEAEAEERVGGSDPDVMPGDFNPALHLNIAADSPERLRKADVFRVLEWAPPEHLAVMAEWLQGKRPDLKEEIDSALLDIEEERGSNPASSQATSPPDVTTTVKEPATPANASQSIDASASNPAPPSPGFSGKDDNGHCWNQGKMIPCPDESPSATLPASAASEPSSTELTKSEIIRNNQNNIDNSSAGDTISGSEEVKTQPEERKMSKDNFQPIPHTKGEKGTLVIRGDTKAIKSELSAAKWKWQPDRKVWQLDMPAPYADKIREGGDTAKEWIKNLNGFKKGVLITLDGYIVFKSKEYTGEIAGIYPGNNGKEDPANTPRVDVEAILQPLGLKAIGSPQEFTKSLTGKDQGLSHIGREFSVDGKKYVTVEAGQPYHISGDAAESSGQKPGWKQKHLSVEIQEFSPEKQRADKIAELEQKIKMYEFPSDDDRGEPQRLETLKQLKKELASQNSNSSSSASVETSRIDVQPVEVQPEKKMSLIKITGKTFPHKEEIKIASDGTAKFDDDGWIVPADVADKLRDLPGLEFNIAPPQLEGSEYDVMSAKQTYKAFLEYTKTYADVILRQNHASAVEFYPALKENPYDSLTWKAIADKLEESGDAKLTRAIPGIRAIATVLQHKDAAWWLQHKGQDSKTIIKSVM